jgi:DNA modification methylase
LSKSQKYYYDIDAIKEEAHTTDASDRNRDESRLNNTPGRTRMAGLTTNHYETKNKRSVWTVTTKPYEGAHFAVFPQDLIEPCILAGAPVGGVVLDPFMGSGTTAQVAQHLGRKYLGCELNPAYAELQSKRLQQPSFEFA